MDLSYTPEEAAFRAEVRAFLKDNLPERLSAKVKAGKRLTKDDYQTWHRILSAKGWLAINWPEEWGGPGWTPVQKHIFEEECVAAGTPRIIAFGLNMLGPVLIKYGSEEQKQTYLPRILNDEDWWAQGYSEPGSGSDLASLKTKAVKSNGELWGWGSDLSGQLGTDQVSGGVAESPVEVWRVNDVKQVGMGQKHSIILTNSGYVFSCGHNWGGELGDGTETDRHVPVQVIAP